MESVQGVNLRKLRASDAPLRGKCVAYEIDAGYEIRFGDMPLCAVNTGRPRVFRSLDTVLRALKEMGLREFEVVAKATA